MAYHDEDLFDILNPDGSRTGLTKARGLVHRDGDLHGASHTYITRLHQGHIQILLQKRSQTKDSFPGCLDTSSAGHLDAGEDFDAAARRELKEELGVNAMPTYLFTRHMEYEEIFHGKRFHDHELIHVYFLDLDQPAEAFAIETCELDAVLWMDLTDIQRALSQNDDRFCLVPEEINRLTAYLYSFYATDASCR